MQHKKNYLLILTMFVTWSSIQAFAQQKSSSATNVTVITHVGIIDATGSPIQQDMTVVISGNKIITLDKAAKVSIPKNGFTINAKGKYLIPGLWDMHFHAFRSLFKSDYRFTICIANGVTGLREMWTKMDEIPQVNAEPWFLSVLKRPDPCPHAWERNKWNINLVG